LVAETIQGVTPDPASVASGRLFCIISAVAEGGAAWVICLLDSRQTPDRAEFPVPPPGSVPFEDSEPDEVCLASFPTPARLAGLKATRWREARLRSFNRGGPPVGSDRPTPTDIPPLVGGGRPRILSLCRLTC
jgi:hypothetical protein